ncbi:tyrosine phosphatase family-domain-containing protein [Cladochytrium replicatum]|nr:tyrosine phosphatase family-domain-containing protein [Cladochytrium replicatum]
MSLKVEIRNGNNESIVGRFELRGKHASAHGISDEKNVSPLILDRSGSTLQRPTDVAGAAVDDVLDGRSRPVVLILHGYWGHKDYLYQKALAKALVYPSFRFDCRSNGESSHPERSNDIYEVLADDVDDLNLVIDVLIHRGWRIFAIVAHSRGAPITFRCLFKRPYICRFFVNVAGRFNSSTGFTALHSGVREAIEKQGYYEQIDTLKNGASKTVRLTAKTEELWKQWDIENIPQFKLLPRTLPILTIHGTDDALVPVADAADFASNLPNSALHIIRGGDHFFMNEHANVVIRTTIDWLHEQTTSISSFYRAHCITPPIIGAGRSRIGKEKAGKGGNPSSLVDGVQNFRDFGGYPVRDGRIVRWEYLYRCGSLSNITELGKKQLQALGITHTIDLRSSQEVDRYPSPPIQSVERVACPVFVDQDCSPAELAKQWMLYTVGGHGFAEAYMSICEGGSKAYVMYLRHLIRTKQPAVLHCTAGKDRTGVFAALLLKFLEVDDDIIFRDFALTEVLLSWSDAELQELVQFSNGALTLEGARNVLSARPEAMQLFFEKFAEVFRTVENYYEHTLGLSRNEMLEIRELLVVEAHKTCPPLPAKLRALL